MENDNLKDKNANDANIVLGEVLFYAQEIDALFRELFYQAWMDENDWSELLEELNDKAGINYKVLNEQIEVGVKNGYSVEFQMDLCRKLIKKNFA